MVILIKRDFSGGELMRSIREVLEVESVAVSGASRDAEKLY